MYYPKTRYHFVKFERSTNRHKKYDAILENVVSKRLVRLPFGEVDYEQYRDRTGLGRYSKQDHGDLERRAQYRQRHKRDVKPGFYSPGYFAWYFLW
jgi:hypothetical protein